jgi:hypothetical protein
MECNSLSTRAAHLALNLAVVYGRMVPGMGGGYGGGYGQPPQYGGGYGQQPSYGV